MTKHYIVKASATPIRLAAYMDSYGGMDVREELAHHFPTLGGAQDAVAHAQRKCGHNPVYGDPVITVSAIECDCKSALNVVFA